MHAPSRRQLDRIAAGQLGVIIRRRALEDGQCERTIDRRLLRAEWVRIEPGAYRAAGTPKTWEQRALAACLVRHPKAVLSHHSAARVWGMPVPEVTWIDVTVARRDAHPRSSKEVKVHVSRDLSASDAGGRDELRVTSPWRTLVDLAAVLTPDELQRVVDDTLSRGLIEPGILLHVTSKPLRGHRGISRLRKILAPWLEHPEVESYAEIAALRFLARAGLGKPVTQLPVDHLGQRVAVLDFAWPDRRVGLEVDGHRFHSTPRRFGKDRKRDLQLTALGWHVVRCSAAELLRDPAHIVDALSALLGRRSA